MTSLRAYLQQLTAQQRADRRTPAMQASVAQAHRLLAEASYTGITITHWANGQPMRIEFPHPVGIELQRT